MSAYDVRRVDLPVGEPACVDDPDRGPNADVTYDCDITPTQVFRAVW